MIKNVHHFGSPFIDIVIKGEAFFEDNSTTTGFFEDRLGGISNTIELACKLDVTSHLLVSNDSLDLIKSLTPDSKKIEFHVIPNHEHHRAVIIDSSTRRDRKSIVSIIKHKIFSFDVKPILFGSVIISYIENFPIKIDSLCSHNVTVFADFNNSIDLSFQTQKFKRLIKNNLMRVNYFLFSDEELHDVEAFIKDLNVGKEDFNFLSKVKFISHNQYGVTFYKIDCTVGSIELRSMSTVSNNYHLDTVRSFIGNGDLFLLLFSYYYDDNIPANETVSKVMEEISNLIKTTS